MPSNDREHQYDSNGGRTSFWDGLGVEFKGKYIFDFRSEPRVGGVHTGRGARDKLGTEIALVWSTNVICLNFKTRPRLAPPC